VLLPKATPVEWLAQADPDPEHAFNWWVQHPNEIAMLPLGSLFDVVKTGLTLGQRILMHLTVTERRCPCFVNLDLGTMYFLVPPNSAASWPADADAEYLGEGMWLWVPVPTRVRRDGTYWAQAPDGTGLLHEPQSLQVALTAARGAS